MIFDNFKKLDAKHWKSIVLKNLKDGDEFENLITKTPSGIDIDPFYHGNQIKSLENTNNTINHNKDWKSISKIEVDDSLVSNRLALHDITNGANSIYFVINERNVDLIQLVENISNHIFIYISLKHDFDIDNGKISILKDRPNLTFLHEDLLSKLVRTGDWKFKKLEEFYNHVGYQIENTTQVIHIDARIYQNSGANHIEELSFILAHLTEYLNVIYQGAPSKVKIVFEIAIGGNFFFEVAKIKSLRLLCDILLDSYEIVYDSQIIATPATKNKTILESELNIVRSCTECMSAIFGGVDFIYNFSYDNLFMNENEFSERVAVQQLNILREECDFKNFFSIEDSFYLKYLIDTMVNESLNHFKEIENHGGFLENLKKGHIQSMVSKSRASEQASFDKGETSLVGINCFTNDEAEKIDLQKTPFLSNQIDLESVFIEPIIPYRLAEGIEKRKICYA